MRAQKAGVGRAMSLIVQTWDFGTFLGCWKVDVAEGGLREWLTTLEVRVDGRHCPGVTMTANCGGWTLSPVGKGRKRE
jgi:hypothetical protein